MALDASLPAECVTRAVLRVVRSLGYAVSVRRAAGRQAVEMWAVDARVSPPHHHVARVPADEPDADHRCACLLAASVGLAPRG